jgi:hypothetical protein
MPAAVGARHTAAQYLKVLTRRMASLYLPWISLHLMCLCFISVVPMEPFCHHASHVSTRS